MTDDVRRHDTKRSFIKNQTSFTAPEQAGDYTYVCTFPGHWVTTQGTMHVVS